MASLEPLKKSHEAFLHALANVLDPQVAAASRRPEGYLLPALKLSQAQLLGNCEQLILQLTLAAQILREPPGAAAAAAAAAATAAAAAGASNGAGPGALAPTLGGNAFSPVAGRGQDAAAAGGVNTSEAITTAAGPTPPLSSAFDIGVSPAGYASQPGAATAPGGGADDMAWTQ
ncbi:hypothetical protein FOA52_003857 [Chlamydomonas sp. UWO 241]|nr:hypothetical protein FOA52_003857 [Chlamydomonas sp. UWO 241]